MEAETALVQRLLSYHKHSRNESPRLAIHMNNGGSWLAVDKLATKLGWVIIPIPHFFSPAQIQYLVEQASIDAVCCDSQLTSFWEQLGFTMNDIEFGVESFLTRSIKKSNHLPEGTHKITFTSGTTNEPKGVCLSFNHLNTVAKSLAQSVEKLGIKRHISLLPYSVLLENMASVYANSLNDIEVISLPMNQVGLEGSGQLDITVMFNAIKEHQAESMILMPQMLKQLVQFLQSEPQDVSFIKFIAVGGAVCAASLIKQAKSVGLPVYQGYGISECGSVICLNDEVDTSGSVGNHLPHCEVSLADDGEIVVSGPQYLGYLGQEDKLESPFMTGDIGRFDELGRLIIIGRKKNIIINSFGRNISPDWIEGELQALKGIYQAAVFGDGEPFLSALCVTDLSPAQLDYLVKIMNLGLPDYARIQVAVKVPAFTVANGQLTPSGKLKHTEIFYQHKNLLESIYAPNNDKTITHTI